MDFDETPMHYIDKPIHERYRDILAASSTKINKLEINQESPLDEKMDAMKRYYDEEQRRAQREASALWE